MNDNNNNNNNTKGHLNTVPNSNVIHMNDSVTTNKSLRNIGKRARHRKDSTSTSNDDHNKSTTTTTKDHLNTVPNSNVIHMNESVTTNNTTDKSIVPINTQTF